jgi:UDP-glucose 4-epimerase
VKILVTGGAGYIGSHTTHQLVEAGHEVVVLDNLYSGHKWALPAGVQFVEGDVGDRQLLEQLFTSHKFDGVMHFAAHIEVEESVRNPVKYYRNNTVNALCLFEACAKAQIGKVIFSSTAAVYGDASTTYIDELQPLKPMNPYGSSKMMTECILKDIAAATIESSDSKVPSGASEPSKMNSLTVPSGAKVTSGSKMSVRGPMRYVILRYFNVAGARIDGRIGQATPRATHLIKSAAETALGVRSQMAIFGTDYPTKDGTCERDYIHVEDLACAHLDALTYLENGGTSDVFNVGYGKPYSVRAVIEMMKRVSNRNFTVIEHGRRAGDPVALAADSSKIKRVLNWKPRYESLELICQTAFSWEEKLQSRARD